MKTEPSSSVYIIDYAPNKDIVNELEPNYVKKNQRKGETTR